MVCREGTKPLHNNSKKALNKKKHRPPVKMELQKRYSLCWGKVGRERLDGLLQRVRDGIRAHQVAKIYVNVFPAQIHFRDPCKISHHAILGQRESSGLQRQNTTLHPHPHDVAFGYSAFLQAGGGIH